MRHILFPKLKHWVALAVGLGLTIGASQTEAMAPARTTTIHLQNKTDKTLYLANASGKWTPKLSPPSVINPGQSLYWKSEPGGLGNLKDVEGNVRYTIGSATWHSPTSISPAKAVRSQGNLLSLSHSPDAVDVFHVAPDGSVRSIWYTVKVNKWSDPYVVAPAGATRANTSLAGVCRAPGHIDLFWITPKGEIFTRAFANGKWAEQKPVTGPGEVRVNMNLSAVSNDKNWIDVFYVGTDNSVKSCSWRGAATWNKPESHSPANSVYSELTAITRTKDEIHIFYGNQESGISSVWWRTGVKERKGWNGPGKVTEKSTVGSGSRIDAVAANPKHLAVFWVNKAGALCTAYSASDQDGGKWQGMYPLSPEKGAEYGSPVLAANRTSSNIDVFWRSPEGAVMTSWFAGGQWGKAMAISPAKACFSKMTSVSRVAHHIDVFWVDEDGKIVTNWWDAQDAPDITIRWTNPLVESQYGNKYYEQVPTGYALSHTGGQGSEAKAYYVLEKTAKRMVKDFQPKDDGFKFSNLYWKENNIKIPVLFVEFPKPIGKIEFTDATQGMCGGMCFTVMDYFLARQKLPSINPAPMTESDPMFQYIRQRQMTSWDLTGTGPNFFKYMRPDYPDTNDGPGAKAGLYKGRSFVIAKEEWPKIKAEIDANRLSPMGLVQIVSILPTDLGKNHQVLAYGYQLDGTQVSIFYYDPSKPKAEMELRFNIGDLSKPITISRFKNGVSDPKSINTFFRMPYIPPPSSLKRF